MPLQKIKFNPGVHKDDSPLEAQGYWIDADKIRFVNGLPETIYGWEKASSSTLLGICRGATTWADNGRNPFAAFGTHLRLYAMDVDGNITDITPVSSRTFGTSLTFATDGATKTVTLTWAGHGLVQDQKFTLASSSSATVGGITTDGTYVVLSVTDANTVTFTAAQTSTSVASTAITSDTTVYLAPGQTDGLGGLGYGTGGYGTGGYGSSASGYTLYPRTWSLCQWGQNLIANPRGGGIYEWAPNVTATQLVTNGTFTGAAAGWTLGAGWAYGANNVVATNAITSLSQSITLPVGAWCLLRGNISAYTSGSVQPKVNNVAIGAAITAAGRFARPFYTGAGGTQTLAMVGLSASLTVDDMDTQVETYGNLITGAPTQATSVFVTSTRQLVAVGCPKDITNGDFAGTFDALRIAWTDTQNNQTWTATASNLAGSATLTNGSRLMRGLWANGEGLIFTDTALYAMRFNPDPTIVFDFPELGEGCGLIGPNAAVQVAGVAFWLSPGGQFYTYAGGYPRPAQCTLRRDVMDNLAWVQQDKIYAFAISARNEVWWLYPDSRDGNECSRYVIYNYVENHWSCGTFNRSAWVDAGVFEFALAVDTAGSIWFHEKDFTEDGGPRSWRLESAYFDLADGGQQLRLMAIQPDASDLRGGYTIQADVNIRNSSGIIARTFGPYNVNSATGKISTRINGQEAAITFAGNSAPTFWRLGAVRLYLQESGRTR